MIEKLIDYMIREKDLKVEEVLAILLIGLSTLLLVLILVIIYLTIKLV